LLQSVQQLQSSVVAPVSNYVVGVFREGQLHLTPVSAIMQMRPTMSYIDEADDDMEVDDDYDGPTSLKVEQDIQEKLSVDIKEVQVQFKKRQSERAIAAMHSSYAYKRQLINAEKWQELGVVPKEVIFIMYQT